MYCTHGAAGSAPKLPIGRLRRSAALSENLLFSWRVNNSRAGTLPEDARFIFAETLEWAKLPGTT
jgi:hypothetical protein